MAVAYWKTNGKINAKAYETSQIIWFDIIKLENLVYL
jgi:hypothetical protein